MVGREAPIARLGMAVLAAWLVGWLSDDQAKTRRDGWKAKDMRGLVVLPLLGCLDGWLDGGLKNGAQRGTGEPGLVGRQFPPERATENGRKCAFGGIGRTAERPFAMG